MGRVLPRLLLACLGLGLAVPAAADDTIRLRSGKQLDVESVRVEEDRLNVTVRQDGVASRVELRFDRVEPREVLRLLDGQAEQEGGHAWLRAAQFAFDAGMHDEAAMRYVRAAGVDKSLTKARDEGLAKIRRTEATEGVRDLEMRVRSGKDARGDRFEAVSRGASRP